MWICSLECCVVLRDNVCVSLKISIFTLELASSIFHCCLATSFVRLRHRSTAQRRALPLKQDGFLSSSELAQYSHRWHRVCAF